MGSNYNNQPKTSVDTLENKKYNDIKLDVRTLEKTLTQPFDTPAEEQSYEEKEGLPFPGRNTFTDTMKTIIENGEEKQVRAYNTLVDLWKDHPNREQIDETKSFVFSIKKYAKQKNCEILSLGYTDEGTFYTVLTEGEDPTHVFAARMNPLDGPSTREGIARNAPLKNIIDSQYRSSAVVDTEDQLGNKAQIELKRHSGESTVVIEGGVEKPLNHAGNLDYTLEYHFPSTPEGLARKKENENKRAEQDRQAFHGL